MEAVGRGVARTPISAHARRAEAVAEEVTPVPPRTRSGRGLRYPEPCGVFPAERARSAQAVALALGPSAGTRHQIDNLGT